MDIIFLSRTLGMVTGIASITLLSLYPRFHFHAFILGVVAALGFGLGALLAHDFSTLIAQIFYGGFSAIGAVRTYKTEDN